MVEFGWMSGDWWFKALTPIWTGDADGKNGRLILTGLLGSIRSRAWGRERVTGALEHDAAREV